MTSAVSTQACLQGRAPRRTNPQYMPPGANRRLVLISIYGTEGTPGIIPRRAQELVPLNQPPGVSTAGLHLRHTEMPAPEVLLLLGAESVLHSMICQTT